MNRAALLSTARRLPVLVEPIPCAFVLGSLRGRYSDVDSAGAIAAIIRHEFTNYESSLKTLQRLASNLGPSSMRAKRRKRKALNKAVQLLRRRVNAAIAPEVQILVKQLRGETDAA